MINHQDLLESAKALIFSPSSIEVERRKAVSGLYYSLFHRLTAAGGSSFAALGSSLQQQVARAFNHSAMRKVCETYLRAQKGAFPPPLDRLAQYPPNPDLLVVCEQFVRLQEARHEADYDLSGTLTLNEALDAWKAADLGHASWSVIEGTDETRVFLAALLLGDRWSRRA